MTRINWKPVMRLIYRISGNTCTATVMCSRHSLPGRCNPVVKSILRIRFHVITISTLKHCNKCIKDNKQSYIRWDLTLCIITIFGRGSLVVRVSIHLVKLRAFDIGSDYFFANRPTTDVKITGISCMTLRKGVLRYGRHIRLQCTSHGSLVVEHKCTP